MIPMSWRRGVRRTLDGWPLLLLLVQALLPLGGGHAARVEAQVRAHAAAEVRAFQSVAAHVPQPTDAFLVVVAGRGLRTTPASAGTYDLDRFTIPTGLNRSITTGSLTNFTTAPVVTTYNLPVGGTVWECDTTAEFTTALANCANRDIIKLKIGVTFTGPFTLRNRGAGSATVGNEVYIVATDASWNITYPTAIGTRVGTSHVANMPIVTNATTNNSRAITSATGASGYRFVGIAFRPSNGTVSDSVLVYPGSHAPTTANDQCDNVGFDRCLIYANGNRNIMYGLVWRGRNCFAVDTSVMDIALAGSENKAMLLSSSTGPYSFINCRFQGASINVMHGGEHSGILDAVVSDILYYHCLFDKDPAWIGGGYVSKNFYESKASRRVLFDSCIFEKAWADAQQGWGQRVTSSWSIQGDGVLVVSIHGADNYDPVGVQATSATSSTVTFSGAGFTPGALVDEWVILGNYGANNDRLSQRHQITANDTETITVAAGHLWYDSTPTSDVSGCGAMHGWFFTARPANSNTENHTTRWCIFRDLPSVLGYDGTQSNGNGLGSYHTWRAELRDCLAYRINIDPYDANPASFNTYLSLSGEGQTEDWILDHLTIYKEDSTTTGDIVPLQMNAGWKMLNSIMSALSGGLAAFGGVKRDGMAAGKTTLDSQMRELTGTTPDYTFDHITMIGGQASNYTNLNGSPTNWIAETEGNVGFADAANGDFSLTSGLYRAGQSRQALDGKDNGAPAAEIATRTSGVVSGVMS